MDWVNEIQQAPDLLKTGKSAHGVDLFVLSSSTTMKPHSRERPGLILDIYKQSDWEQNANAWGTLYPAMRVVFVTVLFHAPDWNNLEKVFDVLTLHFHGLLWLGGQSHSVGKVSVNTVNHNHTFNCKKFSSTSWKEFGNALFDVTLERDKEFHIVTVPASASTLTDNQDWFIRLKACHHLHL